MISDRLQASHNPARGVAADEWLRRCWRGDPGLWSSDPLIQDQIKQRLGWLNAAAFTRSQLPAIEQFAARVRSDGVRHLVLLGMGGSSLAPEVLAHCFGPQTGFPVLSVVDTTHPDAIRAITGQLHLPDTLFLVSSKSGTTSETLALYRHFLAACGHCADQFVAITDPGTPLQQLANTHGFRRVFLNPADIGGRYSALSLVGMLPAALAGIDVAGLLDTADAAARDGQRVPSPAWDLGQAMADHALAGRDKLTLVLPPSLSPLGGWIEQLVAESTGKQGAGIIAVADEPLAQAAGYAPDRFFVALHDPSDPGAQHDTATALAQLSAAGHPVLQRVLPGLDHLGGEFFIWELATAVAGSVLGINPFDEPDVNSAKQRTRALLQAPPASAASVVYADDDIVAYATTTAATDLGTVLTQWLGQARSGDYLALLAYLPAFRLEALAGLRARLRQRTAAAVTMALGPRYLHSSGQLHKGGPNSGLFLIITDEPDQDLDIPGEDHSFGALIRAQALGDMAVLAERHRRVLHLHLRDRDRGLAALQAVL